MRINREDMLALTRRMTVKRTSMTRIAGGYLDRDGYIDGTFNTGFLKLSPCLEISGAECLPLWRGRWRDGKDDIQTAGGNHTKDGSTGQPL